MRTGRRPGERASTECWVRLPGGYAGLGPVGIILVLGLTLLARAGVGAAWGAGEQQRALGSGRVGAELIAALETREWVVVAISFSVEGTGNARGGAAFLTSRVRARIDSVGSRILQSFAPGEFELRWRYGSVGGLAGRISTRGVMRLLEDPSVLRVDLDAAGRAQLDEARPLAILDAVQLQGFKGAGVTVALIDSGLDTDHADLSDALVGEHCFCFASGAGCCPDGGTSQSGPGSAEDDFGHGTSMAGIITSGGTIAPLGGAPDADIVAIKVLDSGGGFCCASDITAALDWISLNRPDVDLINMSLGSFQLFEGDCDSGTPPAWIQNLAAAIDTLRANGVLSFAPSGNQASATSMPAPACIASTVSVGAVWDSEVGPQTHNGCTDPTTTADQIACFSNRSPTTDLFAPGAPSTSTGRFNGISIYYGTSHASALTAACVALLLSADPNQTPSALESALESSSILVTDPNSGRSFPRLDCAEALEGPPRVQLQEQRACINGLNKGGAKVARAMGKNAAACVLNAGRGKIAKLGPGGDAKSCLEADVRGKVARARRRTTDTAAGRCLVQPDFGASDPNAVNRATVAEVLALAGDLFGSELDLAIIPAAVDPFGARCQAEGMKRTAKLLDTQWRVVLAAKEGALKGQAPVAKAWQLEAVLVEALVADARGRISRSVARLAEKLGARCGQASTPLLTLFPGCEVTSLEELGDCAARSARCRFCRSLNASDDLEIDCDDLDNGVPDGSCPL